MSRPIVWCVLSGLFAACTSTPIKVRDEGVLQVGGRALWRASEPSPGKTWFGLEFDASWAEGEDEEGLDAGQSLVLDDVTFFGPARVAIDYELRQTTLAGVMGVDRQGLGTRFLFGVGWQDLDLELASGAQRASASDRWAGLLLGAEMLWTGYESWGLGGRLTWSGDLDDFVSEMRVLELGAQLWPHAPVGLFAGWRWLDYYRGSDAGSDVDLRANGPSIGLRVNL